MSTQQKKSPRGRPKTVDRDAILDTALAAYWTKGPTSVPISEICTLAEVSKPGLYREFGNDDGLKAATLDHYHDKVLTPLYRVLEKDAPFSDVIDAFIAFVTQDRATSGIPEGCLQHMMRADRADLGPAAAQMVDALRQKTLGKYQDLITRAKTAGTFPADMSPEVAALFMDAQNGSAMRLQREGVPNGTIRDIMHQAFRAFR